MPKESIELKLARQEVKWRTKDAARAGKRYMAARDVAKALAEELSMAEIELEGALNRERAAWGGDA